MSEENAFVATLPEELRKEPSLMTFKDAGGLAKSYVEAQKLIGHARVAIPGEKANDAEWDAFYNKTGRPETADKYSDVVLKNEKGEVVFTPDPAQTAELKKFFHKMGLSGRQATAMQETFFKHVHEGSSAAERAKAESASASVKELQAEWGDKFAANVDTARAVIKKFGGDQVADIVKHLDDSGLGNHPQLVRLLAKIGESIMEDTSRRGTDDGTLPINDQTRAMQEIDRLKTDPEFQKMIGDARAVGHKDAINRWTALFKMAYPGAQEA